MSSSGECACGGTCSCNSAETTVDTVELTRDEYIARLENYLQDLKAEIASVTEELESLRVTG